jgi:nucleoside-diphosphate-sugar epimerase
MKFLIFGHKGWIGSMVINLLNKQKIGFVCASSRADDKIAVEEEIIKHSPTHIMSFIGRTHGTTEDGTKYPTIDYLEQKGKLKENIRDNIFAPMVLGLLCKKYNIHFTYLGTGCIFDYDTSHLFGNEQTGFNENDIPNYFNSSYSTVKGYTDQLMHLLEDDCLNLRIRMPINDKLDPRNFITKILNYEYICSIPNSMTVLDDLLPCAIKMAINKETGTINLTNPGVITHNEILEMYSNIIDPSLQWKNFTIEQQDKVLAAGRSNNCLDTTKLQGKFPNILHIKESVKQTIMRMKKK